MTAWQRWYSGQSASMEYTWFFSNIPVSATKGLNYHQVFNIRRTLVGYKIVDHSDVVGASPVGAAPTTASFST